MKRKDYNDAIEEIEAAIKESGEEKSVSEPIDKSNDKTTDEPQEEKSETKRGLKRKLSNDSASNEPKIVNRKPSPVKPDKKDDNTGGNI